MKAVFCDMYNFQITGDVSAGLNANSGLSANHAGPTLLVLNDQGGSVMDITKDVTATLRAQDHGHPPVVCFEPGIAKREGSESRFVTEKCTTLRADMGDNQPAVCYPINLMVATRGGRDDMRTCFGVGEPGDPQFTLSAAHEHGVCYAIEGNIVDRVSAKNGKGWCEDVSPTLNTQDRHAVVYDGSSVTSPKNWNNPKPGDPCYALHTDSRNYVVISMEGNGARPSHMGKGFSKDGAMYTLNTIEQHSVCYSVENRHEVSHD